jgi:hypothetical protein
MNILGNELADKAAKKGTELQKSTPESYISLAFIKRKIKESALDSWTKDWIESKRKGRHYSQFECKPKWKPAIKAKEKKEIWSAFMQLKLGHGYFRSYLSRLPEYSSANCIECKTKENPEHLLLHCRRYSQIRSKIKTKKQLQQISLKTLFNTKLGQEFIFEYLKQTGIATRKWLKEQEE